MDGGLPNGACSAFRSNLYRPALCVACFQDIAAHFPGQWKAKTDFATGRKVYVNIATGTVLNTRPGEAFSSSNEDDGGKHSAPMDVSLPSGVLVDRITGWTAFAAKFEAEAHSRPSASHGSAEESHVSAGLAPPTSRIGDDDDDDDGEDDDGHGRRRGVVAGGPTLNVDVAVAPQSVLSPGDHVPETPTAVPEAALANMAINLQALSAAMGGGAIASPARRRGSISAAPSSAPVAGEPYQASSDEARLPPPPPPPAFTVAPPPSPPVSVADDGSASSSRPPLAPKPPPAPRKSTGSDSRSSEQGVEAAVVASSGAVSTLNPLSSLSSGNTGASLSSPNISSQPNGSPSVLPAEVVDLSSFLAPVYEDPLLVDLNAWTKVSHASRGGSSSGSGVTSGVSVLSIKQPFEESLSLPRYLIITPFTIMAVAAHPTKLGFGILKWERSLLSLRHLATQPLIRKVSPDGAPGAPTIGLGTSGVNNNSSTGSKIASFFNRKRAGSASGTNALPSDASSGIDSTANTAIRINTVTGQQLEVYGVGVLASFAAENADTITFLRTYRAGRRPVVKEGYLHKRKKSAWREHAPLGPLAWKKRWFVLTASALHYYSGPPSASGASEKAKQLKGVIPLTGWVEVARVENLIGGAAAAATGAFGGDVTTKKHSFVVRTGTTFHVFHTSSASEADEWVTAIAINAQHLGATQNDPQCLELQTAQVASDVAAAIDKRRRFLVDSMSAEARADMGDAAELTLDIMNEIPRHIQHRQFSGRFSRGGSYRAASSGGGSSYDAGEDDGEFEELPVDPNEKIDGMSVAEALAIADAAGEEAVEVIAQLPPALASAVRRYKRQQRASRNAVVMPPLAPGEGAWYYLGKWLEWRTPAIHL